MSPLTSASSLHLPMRSGLICCESGALHVFPPNNRSMFPFVFFQGKIIFPPKPPPRQDEYALCAQPEKLTCEKAHKAACCFLLLALDIVYESSVQMCTFLSCGRPVVAQQVCDNELSADGRSCDRFRQVTPWQHKRTRGKRSVGKCAAPPGKRRLDHKAVLREKRHGVMLRRCSLSGVQVRDGATDVISRIEKRKSPRHVRDIP